MIIIHDETGMITQTVFQPIPPNYEAFLKSMNTLFIMAPDNNIDTMTLYADSYVKDGELCARPSMELPATIDINVGESRTFTVPVGSRIEVDGQVFENEDGVLEIEGGVASSYEIGIIAFPYLSSKIEVTVHEA